METAQKRWRGPPLKRERPPIAGTIAGAQNSFDSSSETKNSAGPRLLQWAIHLDRLAHQESVFGHAAVAERLSQQAAEMREAGQ